MMKKIFLYGDSISIQYQPYLQSYVEPVFWIDRKGNLENGLKNLGDMSVNGGDSAQLLNYLEENCFDADWFLFNTGLHDIRIFQGGGQQVDISSYHENLRKSIKILRSRQVFPIFITTTWINPFADQSGLEFLRTNETVYQYNQTGVHLMRGMWVPVIDLAAYTKYDSGTCYLDSVHFSDAACKRNAAVIAKGLFQIEKEINGCVMD